MVANGWHCHLFFFVTDCIYSYSQLVISNILFLNNIRQLFNGGLINTKKIETRGRKPLNLTPSKKQQYILERDNTWRKEHTSCINVRINIETDSDILEKILKIINSNYS